MRTRKLSSGELTKATMIPNLLQDLPQARAVLDRYGLRGCGGPLGPVESVEFFARAHDVPLEQLLSELRQVAEQPREGNVADRAVPAPTEALANSIYRPFFTAGIFVMLTLGVSWGAFLLLRIAAAGRFDGLSVHEVNAHGHAQIFGWVGLFVMGFAYQAFPRFKHTSLAHPRWAYASFWMMFTGLVVRSVAQGLTTSWPAIGLVGVAASVLEVAAIGIMLFVVVSTLRNSDRGLEVYDYYILAALGWFFVQAAGGTVYFAATLAAANRQSLLWLIATWQAPLREVQIHGFATLMILGVSQRLFHHFYGFPTPSAARGRVVLPVFNLALLGIIVGFVLMGTRGHAWAGLWYASAVLLAASIVFLVLDWKLFSKPGETDRSLKFLRTAYVWLFVSLGMLVLLPVYQMVLLPWLAPGSHAAQIGFSHAYYGAIRHAVTVGFVSFMIVGVAAKVVPTLNGVDVHRLGGLWVPYMLLLSGCTLRVVGQTATDFTESAFPVTGVSGLLELAGLTIWGVHLLRLMAGRRVVADGSLLLEVAGPSPTELPITAEANVGAVLRDYPWLLDTFVAFGFTPLRHAVLRNTIARRTTIRQAARLLDVDLAALLGALNRECQTYLAATETDEPSGEATQLPILPTHPRGL